VTPQERAEKIFNDLNDRNGIHLDSIDEEFQIEIKEIIAAEIQAAVDEAKRDKQEFYDQGIKDAYLEGAADEREACARLADGHALIKGAHIHKDFKYCVQKVADQIRARGGQSK